MEAIVIEKTFSDTTAQRIRQCREKYSRYCGFRFFWAGPCFGMAVCCQKGEFRAGDSGIYYEVDSFLPLDEQW